MGNTFTSNLQSSAAALVNIPNITIHLMLYGGIVVIAIAAVVGLGFTYHEVHTTGPIAIPTPVPLPV
jgi:hypothetical protein